MIRRGATSFWEAYNLGLPKYGWHRMLRADLPPRTHAAVSMPVSQGTTTVQVNGKSEAGGSAEGGRRAVFHLNRAGRYTLTSE